MALWGHCFHHGVERNACDCLLVFCMFSFEMFGSEGINNNKVFAMTMFLGLMLWGELVYFNIGLCVCCGYVEAVCVATTLCVYVGLCKYFS